MQCRRCGKELPGDSLKCTFCGYENTPGNVRDLTRTEKNFFDGETIDVGSIEGDKRQERQENFRERRYDYNFNTRRTYVNVDRDGGIFLKAIGWILREWIGGNKLVKVAVTLILVAVAALTVFVALPIIFVILAAGILILTLLSKFR